jgi:hypothetical protein
MSHHEDLQLELPAYATGRLDAVTRARVEAHLTQCGECGALAATFQGLGAAIRNGGDSLFEPHPPHAELRQAARSGSQPVPAPLRAHLDACESCSLELEGWKRVAARAPRPAHRGWGMVALAAAAGVVAGAGLSFLVVRGPMPARADGIAAVGHLVGPQLNLPAMLRSGVDEVVYDLAPDQAAIVTSWPVSVPDEAPGQARYRFEIGPPEGAAVWSQELTAGEIRRHVQAAELVTLLVPASALPPGTHEMRLVEAGASDAHAIYRATVKVSPPAPQAP